MTRRWRLGGPVLVLLALAGCVSTTPDGAPADDRAVSATASASTPSPITPPTTAPTTTTSPATATSTGTPASAGSPGPAGTSSGDGATAAAGTDAVGVARWRPQPGTTWQYQLSGNLDPSVDATVYDVDWQETTAAQVQQLHAAGRRVVCYVNAGAYEDWRPDARDYPSVVLGAPLDGWPGERWVDVRRTDLVLPLLAARMDTCRAKGFDAVEADNVDGYDNDSGFRLTAHDQLTFNTAVAGLAHDRGLSIALKNDVEQVPDLEPAFDFAVNEECLTYDECSAYQPFVDAGKAVLHVEYRAPSARQCAAASPFRLSTIFKSQDLDAALRHC